jgi:P-type Cu2+ transporter
LSSNHPLAAAVASEARERAPYSDAVEEPGRGVRATVGGTEARLGSLTFCGICVQTDDGSEDTSLIGFSYRDRKVILRLRQSLRPDAQETIATLKSLGFGVAIASGDRPAAVAPIAEAVGVTDWRGGIQPTEKIALLDELKAKGHRVLMVGDGLNDAPALAAAYASISPISGIDLAQAQADAVFLGDRLKPVLDTVQLSGHRLMLQNLGLAAIYNALAVPIAMAGLVTPLIAAIAMSGSSLLVTANALRGRMAPSLQTFPRQS